jgi:gamma-glutamylcysteine synthetase
VARQAQPANDAAQIRYDVEEHVSLIEPATDFELSGTHVASVVGRTRQGIPVVIAIAKDARINNLLGMGLSPNVSIGCGAE